jgi:hypothetical protein
MTLPGRLVSTVALLLAVMRHLNYQLAYFDETIERVTAAWSRASAARGRRNVVATSPRRDMPGYAGSRWFKSWARNHLSANRSLEFRIEVST